LLCGGIGKGQDYWWKEDQFEIELHVTVPKKTKTKDVIFEIKPRSIHLALRNNTSPSSSPVILLDKARPLRGIIDVDGTFWSIADSEVSNESVSSSSSREITITIEKMINDSKNDFDVVEYDWGGIYKDDENDKIEKNYKEVETLDIKEYAASLGVDINNINMTMVDKNMFSSGLNMTKNTLDELSQMGYVKEITRQSDGTEFISNSDHSKEPIPFNSLGENVGLDEMNDAGIGTSDGGGTNSFIRNQIPFIDMPSKWQQAIPVEETRDEDNEPITTDSNQNTMNSMSKDTIEEEIEQETNAIVDPIDLLTVAKLKEILKRENLKVTGNKQELKDRLRNHVNSILEKNKE
jgi:hypothetical protein